eukprot:CAMPEP_0203751680 /NCGR_PEP_ID=MMETSP0098-20131031/5718_1 /ASSEMBLY_ACC=CAM_ASM_000208 /TAXON_ID=96639 /ORGANISM=" , Strain NY0313808BC1" /LENGTH=2062 /DNA_ID=CAMNT_0050641519 /DNA_START=703 /DNA_END=6891 /DNA_ORIENTATION=+
MGPLLRVIALVDVPLDLIKIENQVQAPDSFSERFLRFLLFGMFFFCVLLVTLSNIFLTPFGLCAGETYAWVYRKCPNITTVGYALYNQGTQDDTVWHVAGNWVFICWNTLFVIQAVFFADCYIHAGADLLVEVQARVAESLMRYGVVTTQEEMSSSYRNLTRPGLAGVGVETSAAAVAFATSDNAMDQLYECDDDEKEQDGDEEDDNFDQLPPPILKKHLPMASDPNVDSYDAGFASGSRNTSVLTDEFQRKQVQKEIHRASQLLSGAVWKHISDVDDILRVGAGRNSDTSGSKSSDEGRTTSSAGKSSNKTHSVNGFVNISHNYIQELVDSYSKVVRIGFAITYSLSLAMLIGHATIHLVLTDKTIAFFQSVGILMSDVVLWIKFSGTSYSNSKVQAGEGYARVGGVQAWVLSLVLLAARLVLVSVPSNAWFLGQSCMFVMMLIYVSQLILADYAGNMNAGARLERRKWWARLTRRNRHWTCMDIFKFIGYTLGTFCRELAFCLFSIYFGLLIYVLSQPEDDGSLGTRIDSKGLISIRLLDDEISQWKIGLVAMLLVANFVVAYGVYLLWKRTKTRQYMGDIDGSETGEDDDVSSAGDLAEENLIKNLNRKVLNRFQLAMLTFFGVCLVLGLAIFSAYYVSREIFQRSDKFSIIGTVATLLPALFVGIYTHLVWVRDDFVFWKTIPPVPILDEQQVLTGDKGKDRIIRLYTRKLHERRKKIKYRNLQMVLGTLIFISCFVMWGIGLHFEIQAMPFEFCILFPCAVFSLVCGLLGGQLWFNTLQVSNSLVTLFTAHILTIVVAFGVGLEEVLRSRDSEYLDFLDVVGILLLLMPVFNLGLVSLVVYKDDGFNMSYFVGFSALLCVLVSLGLGLWFYFRFDEFVTILYYLIVFFVYTCVGIWLWWNSSRMDGLPLSHAAKITMVIVTLIVLAFIALGIWDALTTNSILVGHFKDPLQGLSYFIIAYVIVLIYGIIQVINKARKLERNATCTSPSSCLLGIPVVAYKVEHRGGELLLLNHPVIWIVCLILSVQLCGYVISITVSPNIGISINCVAMCLLEIFALHMSFVRCIKFRGNLLGLENFSGLDVVFERILQEAVERCLQIAQQAMMATWLAREDDIAKGKEVEGNINITHSTLFGLNGFHGTSRASLTSMTSRQRLKGLSSIRNTDSNTTGAGGISDGNVNGSSHKSLLRMRLSSASKSHMEGNGHNPRNGQATTGPHHSDTDSEMITIGDVDSLKGYYDELWDIDNEFCLHMQDSTKYQALFHVLFWMRTTQLVLEQRVRENRGQRFLKEKNTFAMAVEAPSFDAFVNRTPEPPLSSSEGQVETLRTVSEVEMTTFEKTPSTRNVRSLTQCNSSMLVDGFTLESLYAERNDQRRKLVETVSKRKGHALGGSVFEDDMNVIEGVTRALRRASTATPAHKLGESWVHCSDETAIRRYRAIMNSCELSVEGKKVLLPWVDDQFTPTNGSLFIDWDDDDEYLQDMDEEDIMGALWCRPHQLFPGNIAKTLCRDQMQVVPQNGKYDPTEIMQGGIGDCWLLSAISVVALYPELLNRVLVTKTLNKEGVYHIRLFLDGKWENIFVDDQFPCSLEQSLLFNPQNPATFSLPVCDTPPDVFTGSDVIKNGGNIHLPLPQYCRSRNGNMLWPMLIEKAYAKRFGSYESLNGGHVHSALVDLTGGFSQLFSLHDDVELVVSGALWEQLLEFERRGALLAAGSPAMDESGVHELEDGALSTDQNGIVHGHAYSIVRIEDQVDYNGHHRLLQLRDPWGIARFHGPWSRFDKKRWTRRMQKRLNYRVDMIKAEETGLKQYLDVLGELPDGLDVQDENAVLAAAEEAAEVQRSVSSRDPDNGAFWISLEDFVASFKWLYVCQIFDPATWVQKSVTDEWKGESAGGPPNQPNAKYNPQFRLVLKPTQQKLKLLGNKLQQRKPVRVFISISNLQESQGARFDTNLEESEDPIDDNENAEYDYAARSSGRKYPFMSMLLLEIGGKRLDGELLVKNVVASTGKYKDSRDLSFETKLPRNSDVAYTIFPSLFPKGQEGAFRINVYCETDFELEKITY